MVLELSQSSKQGKNAVNDSETNTELGATQLVATEAGQTNIAHRNKNYKAEELRDKTQNAKRSNDMEQDTLSHGDNAMLMLRRDNDVNQCWPLNRSKPFVIGRDDNCDMVLADRQVSRNHAVIRWDGKLYTIEDLGSTNGTHVNGNAATVATPLVDGDVFQIGFKFQVSFVDDGATAPLSSGPISTGLIIDAGNRTVRIEDKVLDPPLSPPQFQLLQLLWDAASTIVSRDQIAESIWPEDSIDGISEQAIDALVRRLRERIAEIDPDNTYIATIRGHGFRLNNRSGDS